MFAGVGTRKSSLYRSDDSGLTWAAIPNQPTGLRPNHASLAADGMLYISYSDDAGPNTMSDGAVWKLDTSSGEWTNITPEKPTAQRKFGYGSITVDAQHPGTILAGTFCRYNGGDDIYRSTTAARPGRASKRKVCATVPLPPGSIGEMPKCPSDIGSAMSRSIHRIRITRSTPSDGAYGRPTIC